MDTPYEPAPYETIVEHAGQSLKDVAEHEIVDAVSLLLMQALEARDYADTMFVLECLDEAIGGWLDAEKVERYYDPMKNVCCIEPE